MAWCDSCLADHDGPCLADRKRLELGRELAAFKNRGTEPCPFCGGRGAGGPFGYAASTDCPYCRGTGRLSA